MSQTTSHEREIDSVRYTVHYLDPETAITIFAELEQLLLPALGQVAGVVLEDGAESDALVQGSIAAALRELAAAGDAARLKRIVAAMMRVTTAAGVGVLGGNDALWRVHFQGKFFTMVKVTAFALEVQYRDFFGGIGSIRTWVRSHLPAKEAAPSGSPPAPVGGPGA